jgi:GT2 family glycosyltransferase
LLHKLTYPRSLILSNDDIRFAQDTCALALATPGPMVAICSWACFLQREECWQAVGEYDEAIWPAYFEDNDYHYRMRLRGLDYVPLAGGAVTHARSSTLAMFDASQREAMAKSFESNRDYYVQKWGGMPGKERFTLPWDGQPLNGAEERLQLASLHISQGSISHGSL